MNQKELQDRLSYNKETGIFKWIYSNNNKVKNGSIAGKIIVTPSGNRYYTIRVDNKDYLAHRLSFLHVTGCMPKNQVDHINGDGLDNRWCNLRDVTRQENNRNTRLLKNNSSGFCGVSWSKKSKKWLVQIMIDKKGIHLGLYDSLLDAVAVRINANIKYEFHSNHGKIRQHTYD